MSHRPDQFRYPSRPVRHRRYLQASLRCLHPAGRFVPSRFGHFRHRRRRLQGRPPRRCRRQPPRRRECPRRPTCERHPSRGCRRLVRRDRYRRPLIRPGRRFRFRRAARLPRRSRRRQRLPYRSSHCCRQSIAEVVAQMCRGRRLVAHSIHYARRRLGPDRFPSCFRSPTRRSPSTTSRRLRHRSPRPCRDQLCRHLLWRFRREPVHWLARPRRLPRREFLGFRRAVLPRASRRPAKRPRLRRFLRSRVSPYRPVRPWEAMHRDWGRQQFARPGCGPAKVSVTPNPPAPAGPSSGGATERAGARQPEIRAPLGSMSDSTDQDPGLRQRLATRSVPAARQDRRSVWPTNRRSAA